MSDPTSDTLRRAVSGEPPLVLTLEDVMTEGVRLRRRRRITRGAGLAATVCLVGAAALWFPWQSSTPGSTTPGTGAASGGTATTPAAASASAGKDPGAVAPNALARLVEASSPDGLTFHWGPGAEPDSVSGTVDDGSGPSGFSVGVSTATQQVHPCQDHEFTAGASCTEQTLSSGAVLSRRALSDEPGGFHSVSVVLTYPDGSGVNAGAVNATLADPQCVSPGTAQSPAGTPMSCYSPGAGMTDHKSQPTVTTGAPELTVDDLVAIVLAVDADRR